ncbi:hypothetical protein [Streptomyces sp. 372A]
MTTPLDDTAAIAQGIRLGGVPAVVAAVGAVLQVGGPVGPTW